MSTVRALSELLAQCEFIVAFTGAGISTESGIPDFRGKDGVWTKVQPIEFQDFISSEEMRRESWRRKASFDNVMNQAVPNDGHKALKTLYDRGKLKRLVTQNVDGLHQASGVPAEHVIELHGNATYAACLSCQKRYELEPIIAAFRERDELPVCDCGGLIKSATISFGQPMPEQEMAAAEDSARRADLLLVLGTSLVVYPAAMLPGLTKQAGGRLAILNRDPTDYDGIADLVLHEEIGPTLSAAVAQSDRFSNPR